MQPTLDKITWALFAPIPAAELRDEAERARKRRGRGLASEAGSNGLHVIPGTGDYCALLETELGAEDTIEEAVVAAVRRLSDRPIYVVYFFDDPDPSQQIVERVGRRETILDESPFALAERLGCPLPDALPVDLSFEGRMVSLMPGVDPALVWARAGATLEAAGYQPVPCASGAAVAHPPKRSIPEAPEALADAFPDCRIVVVVIGPEPGRLACWEHRGAELIAAFAVPPSPILEAMGVDVLDSVEGTREPALILERLGLNAGWAYERR